MTSGASRREGGHRKWHSKTVTTKLGWNYKNGTYQGFCPWIMSPQVPASLAATLNLVGGSSVLIVWVFFNLLLLCWISGWVGLHISPLRVGFLFPIVLWFLDLNLIYFHNQMFWDLVFPVPVLRVRVPTVQHNPFTSWGTALYFGDPSQLWSYCVWGEILSKAMSLPFLPYLMHLFCLLLWSAVSNAKILFRKLFYM